MPNYCCRFALIGEHSTAMLTSQDAIVIHRMQMAKKSTEQKNEISVCDILKNNTTKVIRKLEMQIPTDIQAYSDSYTDYLHMLDDYYGTCYLWQKQYFDIFGLDTQALNAINEYWNTVTDLYCTQIDMISSAHKSGIETREKLIKLCDQYIHQALDYYGKIFSQTLTKISEKK